ncbi:MAG: GNAT family N-acetyltransferase [Clostridia bacterium]|nr:GNAT family N-acetyltransferase [Clostridia bacterium]
MSLPQLIMRNPDITTLPPLVLPEGFKLYHHKENCGMEEIWEEIIKSAFGAPFAFDFLIKAGDYKPEHVLYLSYNGRPIATTTAVEHQNYPGEGWYRMVGVRADAQGLGAGRLIGLAALHALRDRGYKSALLSTDDHRIPAISLYLSLGFQPVYVHESHAERWNKVLKILEERKSYTKSP